MAASNIYLISGGVNYYLSGAPGQSYSGSVTPWTAQATSPYRLSMNDATGPDYTPQVATVQPILGGGPPLRQGHALTAAGYDDVVETFGIQMKGTTDDNALALLNQLRLILNSALYSTPCVLAVQPSGTTNTVYFEILHADVQESASFVNKEAQHHVIRAQVTMRRTAFGTALTRTTLINAATFTNTGTGANNNFQTMGTLTGHLGRIGTPLVIALSGGDIANNGAKSVWLASARSREYFSRADAISTTSTTGVALGSTSLATGDYYAGTRIRFTGRVASPLATLDLRIIVTLAATNGTTIYTSPWITPGTANGTYIDFGYIELPMSLKRNNGIGLYIQPYARSNTGGSATGTLSYLERIAYYDWCKLTSTTLPSSSTVNTIGATEIDTCVRLLNPPLAVALDGSANILQTLTRAGAAPRAFEGAGLYAAWADQGIHDTADTITVTVRQAAQWWTLRGGS